MVVPAGFRCDLASVPRLLRLLFSPFGLHQRAGCFHDVCYRVQHCRRFQADALFRSIMYDDRVPMLKRLTLYWGVRIGGWVAWRRNAEHVAKFRELLDAK